MKYMGSKRYMLNNGLATLLEKEVPKATRFVDLFCGAGSVIHHVAEKYEKPTLAADIQQYGVILAGAISSRNKPVNAEKIERDWIKSARAKVCRSKLFQVALSLENAENDLQETVEEARQLTNSTQSRIGPIWGAYGGHYYSPSQALAIDYLIKGLPAKNPERLVAHAALIIGASRIAAAPGHTAQPFQPTETAGKFLQQSWKRDVFSAVENALDSISQRHALVRGTTKVTDASEIVDELREGDLVFLDPPYSGVQYSRFYHVLETIARGTVGDVSGVGRYPSLEERPQSKYSNAGQSVEALDQLMSKLSKTGATIIFTFPKGKCSNGLSGDIVKEVSSQYFRVTNDKEHVKGKFSTLGGNGKGDHRPHKIDSVELILLLKPRK